MVNTGEVIQNAPADSCPLRNFWNSDCILFPCTHVHMWEMCRHFALLKQPVVCRVVVTTPADRYLCRPHCSRFSCRASLLRAVFRSFEQCSGELSLPVRVQGVQGEGQAEAAVTLYQHVCVRLCAFIASLHPSLFPELVSALLVGLHGGSSLAPPPPPLTLWFIHRGKWELLTHMLFTATPRLTHFTLELS